MPAQACAALRARVHILSLLQCAREGCVRVWIPCARLLISVGMWGRLQKGSMQRTKGSTEWSGAYERGLCRHAFAVTLYGREPPRQGLSLLNEVMKSEVSVSVSTA